MTSRLRDEGGFGLVELLIAMLVMSVAIFALVAGFSSSAMTLNRASLTATAGTVADQEMEAYHALPYDSIPTCPLPPTAPDPSHAATSTCTKSVTVDGATLPRAADGRTYQMEVTYGFNCAAGALGGTVALPTCTGTPAARATKRVSVVVRNADGTKVLIQQTSTFDQSTG